MELKTGLAILDSGPQEPKSGRAVCAAYEC